MTKPSTADGNTRRLSDQVETVLAASRVLVGVSAQSLAAVEDIMPVAQFRVLVIIDSGGPMGLQELAAKMAVHPSNATRACDRLVAMGLLDRRDNPEDRRYLTLELTDAGRTAISTVMSTRRHLVQEILQQMAPIDRDHLASALRMFAIAGQEPDPQHLWALGWSTPAQHAQR